MSDVAEAQTGVECTLLAALFGLLLRVLDSVEKLFARAVLFAIEIVSQSPATRCWRGARFFLLRELLGRSILMCSKNHRLFAVLTIQNFLLAAIMATDKTTRPAHTQRI